MSDEYDKNSEKLPPIDSKFMEIGELLLDSLWRHEVKPRADRVIALFTRGESHLAGQKAGTETLSRICSRDPDTDEAYAHV